MKSIDVLIRKIVLFFDRAFIVNVPAKTGIALIRLDAIGDFVVWSHSAKEFRKLFPSQKIVLIANQLWVDLAKKLPYWDEVWAIDPNRFKKNLFYRWRMIRKISTAGIETAVQSTFSRTLAGDSVVRATGAYNRIGSTGDLSNISQVMKKMSDQWYTQLIPVALDSKTDLESNYDFINDLTGSDLRPEVHVFPTLKNLPSDFSIEKDYCIIFPGASRRGRQWPADRFVSLINEITIEFGWYCVLCGSAAEWDLCNTIACHTNFECSNLAGKTSLSDFAELARRSKLIIGNETSAIHIAVAVDTPSVSITGGGHYGRFVPYPETANAAKPLIAVEWSPCFNCNWNCSQPRDSAGVMPCIEKIKVGSVMDLVRQIQNSAVACRTSAILF
jgi:ADP-heptose:LPS heptosyltransferase